MSIKLSSQEKRKNRKRIEAIASGRVYISDASLPRRSFLRDIVQIQRDIPTILWRAWSDTKAKYRRSMIGPLWLTMSTLTFVFGYSILAGFLFKRPIAEFIGYIACGVITWQLISRAFNEGSQVFVSGASEITSINVNLLTFPIKLIFSCLISLAHSLPIVLIIILFTREINLNTLMVIPGFLVLSVTLFGVVLGLSTLSARYRDLQQFTAMVIQFCFYMTPIIWKPEMLLGGDGKWVVLLNPFYYALSIVRLPLLGEVVHSYIWLGMMASMVVSLAFGITTYAFFRQRIPFWV